jgi:tRNA (guanine-N7-)-methyltransferase
MRARAGVASDHFLLVAGSTRPGEEAVLANVLRAVHAKHKNFRMIIAPRHVERVGEVKALLEEKGLAYNLYGDASTANGIILVDRMGFLNDLYMAADLAFVGGTLVDIGGHNILEPVWAGTPVIFGPYLSNVSEAADYILANSYGVKVASESDLAGLLQQVIIGEFSFAVKTENDLRNSPTAMAGDYILKRLKGA